MAIGAKNNSNTFKIDPLEAGIYPGRLVQLVDLGMQAQRPYKGVDKKPAEMIILTYELSDEFLKDEDDNILEDKPRFFSEDMVNYSRVAEQSKAATRIAAFDPGRKFEGFDPSMVGRPVMITITQNPSNKPGDDRIFNNVVGVAPMRSKDAEKLGELVNPGLAFDFDEPDLEVFNKLSNYVQKKIKEALNFKGSGLEAALNASEVDNKPATDITPSPVTTEEGENPY